MPEQSAYFRHSGRVNVASLLACGLLVLALAALVGFIYGQADHYCPLIYGNILLTGLAGLATGLIATRAASLAHVRNPAVALLLGLAAGLVTEYVAFSSWLLALFHYPVGVLLLGPVGFFQVLSRVVEHGAWTLGSVGSGSNSHSNDAVSGLPLILCWLIEGAIIVGIAAAIPFKHVRSTAYCETCRRWITEKLTVLPFQLVAAPAAMRAKLEAGGFGELATLAPISMASPSYAYFELRRCTGCNGLHLLSVYNHVVTRNSKGKDQTTKTAIAHNLLIDAEFYNAIAALRPGAAAKPATASAPAAADTATVKLVLKAPGPNKIQVIRVIREATSLGIKEAKDLVEGTPALVKEGLNDVDAKDLAAKLIKEGADVEFQ